MITKGKTKQELVDMLDSAKVSVSVCESGVEDIKDEIDSLRFRLSDAKREVEHCEALIIKKELILKNTIEIEQEFLKDIEMYNKALTQLRVTN